MAQKEVRYERNPNFVFRRIVDEAVLVPIQQDVVDMDCIYTLNPVGALIWEKLEEGATLAELEAAVLSGFDAEPEVVTADLAEFLTELETAGAVRRL